MFSNQRKTIGVFAERTLSEFQNQLCRGITEEAMKQGFDVAVFTCYGNYGQNDRYYEGEKLLYELPPYRDLAGVIMALDTMEDMESRQILLKHVGEECLCPVISIRELVEGANNFLVDNFTCMEGIIQHFVEMHGMGRLCFMTGPKKRWDAEERLSCFLKMMKEYNLPVEERQIFYGDFWKNKGKDACDWFLGGSEKPDAIICANDHMAVAVASELISRGYRIPEDICVSGYDGLLDSMSFTPSITTAAVPFYEMGKKAVEVIAQKQDCPDEVEDIFFKTKLLARESCGCLGEERKDVITERREQYESLLIGDNRRMQFNFMSINLGECYTVDELSELLSIYVFNIEGFKDYCLCLCENLEEQEELHHYTETMELRIAMKDRNSLGSLKVPYNVRELLPKMMVDKDPQVWYFVPVHFQNKCFGYEAFQYLTPDNAGKVYLHWSINVSNKIQDILVHHEMQKLIDELENMYDRDALTGTMYNRRGFEIHGGKVYNEGKEKQVPVFLAVIDLDGMKQINDNYGHVEGDFALRKICEIIQGVCTKGICARTGGDEFIVVAKGIRERDGREWLQEIERCLDAFNQSGEKEYSIHASAGYTWRIPGREDTIETFVTESDEEMYKNKIANKRRRGEPLR